jgi:hypothetical protein
MTHAPHETVTCSSCGRTFERDRPKVLDNPLYLAMLRELRVDQLAAICGDCYKLFMDWLDQKPTN